MNRETEEKQIQQDQETKPKSKLRTKTVIKFKQENNDFYDIITRKGEFIVSLDYLLINFICIFLNFLLVSSTDVLTLGLFHKIFLA